MKNVFSQNPRRSTPVLAGIALLSFFLLGFTFSLNVGQNQKLAQISPGIQANQSTSTPDARQVMPGIVFVKFKPQTKMLGKNFQTLSATLSKRMARDMVYSVEAAFPFLTTTTDPAAESLQDIRLFRYNSGRSPRDVARDFAADPGVEYAEPQFLYKLAETPNDSLYALMGQFATVSAPAAWDIVKGAAGNTVIAIVDGGTDWQHPDLLANVWTNADETPGNGIDDDGNGFIDDIHGWNFGNKTNDPTGLSGQSLNGRHGTHTAGITAAVTNNRVGIASLSWNCQVMPINTAFAESDGLIAFGYDGIVYAADNGANIISCSWGGGGNASKLEQEVIDFAYAKGALVIAAAGNDGINNDNLPFYPSNYNHVLSVGSVNNLDSKAGTSNYGVSVDVFAPGVNILSTLPSSQYGQLSGTSMATPMAAALAGLVKTLHPDWSVDKIREQIRVSADPIDSRNPSFSGRLGKGRINAQQALTLEGMPAIRIVNVSFTESSGNGVINKGETVNVTLRLKNYLEDATNITLTLNGDTDHITLTDNTKNLPSIIADSTGEVSFQFIVGSNVTIGYVLHFTLGISANGYTDRDNFDLIVDPPEYLDHFTGTLRTSITTEGNIGFFDFDGTEGSGFIFNGANFLFEGGLMVGNGVNTVSDCIRGADGSTQDDDFRPTFDSHLRIVSPGKVADEEGSVVLVDSLAANPLGLRINQETFAYKQEPFNDFVIFKYTIENLSGKTISNLYAGLFFDWDINDDANDYARFEPNGNLGYVQNSASNPTKLAGTKVLTALGATSYRSIDNATEIYGGNVGDGFQNTEKWNFLSGGSQRQSLDFADVSTLTATGPFTLTANQAIEIAFAVVAGSTAADLQANAAAAQTLWDNDLIPVFDREPPKISTSVFQNPAASKYADLVVVVDKLLKETPAVQAWIDTDTSTVVMGLVDGSSTVYKGPLEFDRDGTFNIRVRAKSLSGIDSVNVRSFAVAAVQPGAGKILTTTDGKARLRIEKDAVRAETYFIADEQKIDGETVFIFGPAKTFSRPLIVEIDYDPGRFADAGKLFIYKQTSAGWQALPSKVFATDHRIVASANTLGTFKLGYEATYTGSNLVPDAYALLQNYPNPFNPGTTIRFDLVDDGEVSLVIFNSIGQKVKTLVHGNRPAGSYHLFWDGTDENGQLVSTGVYFYQLKAGQFAQTRKMILLR